MKLKEYTNLTLTLISSNVSIYYPIHKNSKFTQATVCCIYNIYNCNVK